MWTRTVWLTLWTTLAFWFGGCGRSISVNATEEAALLDEQPIVSRDTPAQRSVTGLERTDWEKITLTPPTAGVQHRPVYFTTASPLLPGRTAPLTPDGDIERDAELVTDNDGITVAGGSFGQVALEPLQFAVDMIVMPVRLVTTPPWTVQTSR